ncbi:MAG: zinc ABC transporter substrate-binding protein [Solirubrobacterales bacterium]|nr:zinc ABC transporter substrate-binding protein [Solirubrobacterales bacterium]MCB0862981.1 zinc ABC transporter substrate-binding protein [Solirubrobacterales bacterium]MCB8915723.1 zinc ABC transporter substrate-binding protein [Thermoleophilales bacterium]
MFEAFSLPFFQRGLFEILLLAVPCGLVGSWVVLRGLAFHSHAVGTATFPGLVLADGLGFAAALGAIGAAAAFTLLSVLIARSRRTGTDSVTALALAACLAGGVILASDVFNSGANVDTLLFGSLLAIDPGDLRLAAVVALIALGGSLLVGHHWLARGFDPGAARGLRSDSSLFDAALLAVVAITVVATLSAVGALLVSTLVVVPAATARLFTRRVLTLVCASVALVAVEGTFGLWLSVQTNAPPGATIAVTSGVAFGVALLARSRAVKRALRPLAMAAAVIALALLGTGCGTRSSGGDGPKVVATTTQVGDFVSEVGGEKVDLTTILKPNTDPHEYEPRPSDVQAVADADIIFRSGGHLDDWTDDLIKDSGSDATVVDLSQDLPVRLFGTGDHEHQGEDQTDDGEEFDPHWWQDPVNARFASARIESVLAAANPEEADYYRGRSRRFDNKITDLTDRTRTCIRRVPVGERKIVTDHDAFGYFTNRFGIETVGTVIPALTTEAQPSAGDLADLEKTIRSENVKAIFPEESVSPALSEALAKDTSASSDYSLYGDTLGPEGTPGESWLGSMKSNVNSIVAGMSGGRVTCFGGSGE